MSLVSFLILFCCLPCCCLAFAVWCLPFVCCLLRLLWLWSVGHVGGSRLLLVVVVCCWRQLLSVLLLLSLFLWWWAWSSLSNLFPEINKCKGTLHSAQPCAVHCWISTISHKLILPQFLAKQPSTFECITWRSASFPLFMQSQTFTCTHPLHTPRMHKSQRGNIHRTVTTIKVPMT